MSMIYRHYAADETTQLFLKQKRRAHGPKYRKGRLVESTEAAVAQIMAGHCLYLNHKVQNASWMMGMTLLTISRFVGSRRAWYAIRIAAADYNTAIEGR